MELKYRLKKENKNKEEASVSVKITKIRDIGFDLNIIYSYFLSEMIDGCDDDLICEVVEMSAPERRKGGMEIDNYQK